MEIDTIFLVENLVEIGHWEDLGLGTLIIQKWFFLQRWGGGRGLGLCGLG
jgi:hypothetical protein